MIDSIALSPPQSREFLGGGGIMGELIRSKDWSATPLGPIEHWPQSLRTTVSLCLSSNFPINLIWGPQHIQIYNDGYRPICAGKHPKCLGEDYTQTWASAWEIIGDAFNRALTGETSFLENQRMFLDRNGYLEETFFTFSLSPIRDESGEIGGLFHPVTETTPQMLSQRRTRALQELALRTGQSRTLHEACSISVEALAQNQLDLPFVLIYRLNEGGQRAKLVANAHLAPGTPASPEVIELNEPAAAPWPFAELLRQGDAVIVGELSARVGQIACGPYPEGPDRALVLPITIAGMDLPSAFLVAAVSPRLPFTSEYRAFLDLTAAAITAGMANAHSYQAERGRAEKLAELDRVKTTFFSNVSHEFRTPLTLMIGPLDEMLAQSQEPLLVPRESLDLVHRNSLRLLRLVNTLLDFSRIEANRADARFEPVDLAAFTRDLVSLFRSATDQAGLALDVNCQTLSEEVYVDREMWEKIILNLLSNAFKFTFHGKIAITLLEAADHVELLVSDTGTGIAAEELPHLFKRFHRVQGAPGRSFEGSGIGLALVEQLVKLHAGKVWVESQLGSGTTFHVTIPKGHDHLPGAPSNSLATPSGAAHAVSGFIHSGNAFVEEALRWLPTTPSNIHDTTTHPPGEAKPRIVLADDNADMRHYIESILAPHFNIHSVSDGAEALAAINQELPELVLTDVMMPRLDGFGLLNQLRSGPRTRSIPVIMLSARAGEESRVEGIQSGADDYLVKPFNARELLARVRVNLELARLRRDLAREEEHKLSLEALRQIEARRILALQSSQLGEWEVDLATGKFLRSQRHAEIFGSSDTAEDWTFERFLKSVHPEDRPLALRNFEELKRGQRLESECRIMRPNGETRWILARGDLFRDLAGIPIRLLGSVEDITERKELNQTLRESEEKLRLLLDGVKDYAVYMLDSEGRVATWNEGAVNIEGYAAGEILGKSLALFYTAEARALGYPALGLKQAVETGRYEQQGERVRKDGSTFWAHVVILPLFRADGSLRGFSKVLHDISEQKRAQDALLESEARLQTLADSIPQLVSMIDADGRVLWYNRQWYEYTGLTFEQLKDWGWTAVHDPAILPEVTRKWQRSIDLGEPFEMVFPLRGADGAFRPFLTRVTPLRDQTGKVARWFGTNTDITSQRAIEDALRENEERLRLAQEVAQIGTFEWNLKADGNRQAAPLATFRLPNGELSSTEEFKLGELHPDDRERARQQIAAALQTGSFESELRAVRANGTERWLFVRARVTYDDAHNPLRMIGAVVDITERKTAELKILHMNAELEQQVRVRTVDLEAANKELAAFSYSVSHDLRAPLRGIDGWSMALLEDYGSVLDARAHEYLGRVRGESQRIGNLIDDMLRLSRVTRDEMEIEPVDLTALAADIAAKLREAEPQRVIEFVLEPGLTANGDSRLLEIALTNLLSNAVKFTGKRDKALIEFGKLEERGEIHFYVRDNGAGFDMAYVKTLFGAFQRLHKFTEFPGTGIGLAIVTRVIGRHAGRVWAEAKVNEGATFWFTLGVQS